MKALNVIQLTAPEAIFHPQLIGLLAVFDGFTEVFSRGGRPGGNDAGGASKPFEEPAPALMNPILGGRIMVEILSLQGILFQIVEFSHISAKHLQGVVDKPPRTPA